MHECVVEIIRERFKARVSGEKADAKKKSIVELALETYFAEERPNADPKTAKLDPVFEKYCADQIRTFIFAGHDTTSSTICWAMYMLGKHPEYRAKMVEEHAEVFGKDLEGLHQRIREQPHLLNKLEYTLAFIKECLRLFPAASGIRRGDAA